MNAEKQKSSTKRRVNVVSITNPSDFWIQYHDAIKYISRLSVKIINSFSINSKMANNVEFKKDQLVAVCKANKQDSNWYRAKLIDIRDERYYVCHLIDTGEVMSISSNCCRHLGDDDDEILNTKPFARHCTLFGIKPKAFVLPGFEVLNRKGSAALWMPRAEQFFKETIKEDSIEIYIDYIIRDTSSDLSSLNHVMLYIKNLKDDSVECINHLLVRKNYAINVANEEYIREMKKKESVKEIKELNTEVNRDIQNKADAIKIVCSDNGDVEDETTSLKSFLKSKYGKKDLIENLCKKDTINQKIQKPSDSLNATNQTASKTLLTSSDNNFKNVFTYDNITKRPIKTFKDSAIHEKVKEYLHINGINTINEFESYLWPSVLRGMHLLAISPYDVDSEVNFMMRTRKSKLITFVSPLLTLVLNVVERENEMKRKAAEQEQQGKSKPYAFKRKNGPLLLIVCPSCKNAQRIYELITDIMGNNNKTLNVILLLGGGNDDSYDVKLSNGCDVLICATPYCLLRMIGNNKTNLERLKYFVYDEASVVLDKYQKQVKALMDHYGQLLKVDSTQPIAQFILYSSVWSLNLKKFIDLYFLGEAVLIESKLEASHFGYVNQIVHEFSKRNDRKRKLLQLLEKYESSNIIVFVNDNKFSLYLYEFLKKIGFSPQLINEQTNYLTVDMISKDWCGQVSTNKLKQRILICVQSMLPTIDIKSANIVVHFDFPQRKLDFANRLWTMSDNFKLKESKTKKFHDICNVNNQNNAEIISETDSLPLDSHIFFTDTDSEFSEGLLSYLKRIGIHESTLPENLLKLAKQRRQMKEENSYKKPLCKYLKSFGKCMSSAPNCEYRHILDVNKDKLRLLCSEPALTLPNEGYVKFRIAYIKETNNFFIHLLSNVTLDENGEGYKTIDCDVFTQFDMDMQLYFSSHENRKDLSEISRKKLYAYKDIETNLFKRIKIVEIVKEDTKILEKARVEFIDYGSQMIIDSVDFLELPAQFKELPPQAVEVYLCGIRPVDWDLNWSVTSKLFISVKLAKFKVFHAHIQFAAGNTLWLDPVTSNKKMDALNTNVIEDCIRRDLLENNFATPYTEHLTDLKTIFEASNYPIPKKIKLESKEFSSDGIICKDENDKIEPEYAFLDKSIEYNETYISAVSAPSAIYLQKKNSYESLLDLNKEMNNYIQASLEIEAFKENKNQFITMLKRLEIDGIAPRKIYCIAKPVREKYYSRAQITSLKCSKNTVEVFFVDYGDYSELSIDDLYPTYEKFIRKLPFQAIKCSISTQIQPPNLPNYNKTIDEWSIKISDEIWSLTHECGIFQTALAHVKTEINDLEEELLKNRYYNIDLYRNNIPVPVCVAKLLVSLGHAHFDESKEESLFPYVKSINANNENVRFLNNYAKLCITNFVKEWNSKKQLDFVAYLKVRLANLSVFTEDDLLNSGLISTLSEAIFFIYDPKCLMPILQMIKKNFLIKESFIKEFCNFNGLGNLCVMLFDYHRAKEESLVELLLDIIVQLSKTNIVKQKILNTSEYFRSIWLFLKSVNSDEGKNAEFFKKTIDILKLLQSVDTAKFNYVLQKDDYKYMKEIVENTSFYDNDIKDIFEFFYLKLDNKVREEEVLNDLKEVLPAKAVEFLEQGTEIESKIDENNNRSTAVIRSNYDYDDLNDSYDDDDDMYFDGDSELNEEFIEDFMNLFVAKPTTVKAITNNKNEESMWMNKDYLYPKIEWDQTDSLVIIRILLKNVKQSDTNYKPTAVKFRTKLDDVQYGFDFELYAEIVAEESSTNYKQDFIAMFLKKKVEAQWPRILSTLNKPKFLKSVYDNITGALDEDEKATNDQPNNCVKDYSGDSSDADSQIGYSSDDNCNDINERQDIYWD